MCLALARSPLRDGFVNAGEKMHRRTRVKMHHARTPEVPRGGLLTCGRDGGDLAACVGVRRGGCRSAQPQHGSPRLCMLSIGPMFGFKRFKTATVTTAGIDLLRPVHKGQFNPRRWCLKDRTAPEVWNAVLAAQ